MKPIAFAVITFVLGVGSLIKAAASGATITQELSSAVLRSDHAERSISEADRAKGLVAPVMRDRKWIEVFAQTLAASRLNPKGHVFAVSSRTIFVERNGRSLLSIEELPGNTLRLNGEDYEVDADSLSKIGVLLKQWPNQALVPTPMSVTPAAGAPVAPATGAAHL